MSTRTFPKADAPRPDIDRSAELSVGNDESQRVSITECAPSHRLTLTLMTTVTLAAWLWPDIPTGSRLVLWIYGIVLIAWTTTALPPGWVGLAAVVFLLIVGAVPQERAADLFATNVIWLIFGAFVMGEALTRTGLATRWMTTWTASARTGRGLAWRLTFGLIVLAFLVPSTTGRAALVWPLVRSSAVGNHHEGQRCLSLLVPCVVLLSTPITLLGAAAHLVANDLLTATDHPALGYGSWLVLAGPFGVTISLLAAWIILQRHWPRAHEPLPRYETPHRCWTRAERAALFITMGIFVLLVTTHWHSLTLTTVTLLGTVVLLMPHFGLLDWKTTLKAAPWDLLLFAGTAVWLSHCLVATGTAEWLVHRLLQAIGFHPGSRPFFVVLILCLLSITAHLYLTSHTARVAVLVPPLLTLAQEFHWNPAAVMFLTVLGIDYCLTFPVSSKAILLFELDHRQTANLFRLSVLLMPVYFLMMVIFYFVWWSPLGLSL